MTPLTLSSVSCKFKVNLLEPRQLEPKATGTPWLYQPSLFLSKIQNAFLAANAVYFKIQACLSRLMSLCVGTKLVFFLKSEHLRPKKNLDPFYLFFLAHSFFAICLPRGEPPQRCAH